MWIWYTLAATVLGLFFRLLVWLDLSQKRLLLGRDTVAEYVNAARELAAAAQRTVSIRRYMHSIRRLAGQIYAQHQESFTHLPMIYDQSCCLRKEWTYDGLFLGYFIVNF